jgi:hypothetical protein
LTAFPHPASIFEMSDTYSDNEQSQSSERAPEAIVITPELTEVIQRMVEMTVSRLQQQQTPRAATDDKGSSGKATRARRSVNTFTPLPLRSPTANSTPISAFDVQPSMLGGRIEWGTLPSLVPEPHLVDNWFMSFESIMKSHGVAPERWFARLIQCPRVCEEDKRRMESGGETYAEARAAMLAFYGPMVPHVYWKHQLTKATGATKRELVSNLLHVRSMQVRAARDVGRPEMDETDLVYQFCEAYPKEERERLLGDLEGVRLEDVFTTTVRRAPELPRASIHFAGDATRLAKRSPHNLAEPAGKRPHRGDPAEERCFGCGRQSCRPGERCPAHRTTCHNCGKMGHYRKVCRKQTPMRSVNFCPVAKPDEGS